MNIVSIILSVVSFSLFFLVVRGNPDALSGQGPLIMWGMLLIPLIGLVTSFIGKKGTLKWVAIILSLAAVVICSGLAFMGLFLLMDF
ncbi:hypothetical protein [Mesobacillus zeae]|uniref:Uncharacterized protein n=1 Tax=Mesobacillus zeae TaxID=1917180 RepID=A0A398B570_9BACI|nr:hypothetical protein [Mesobacillus zeae]RID82926.1 hypothetical protein D1970_17700 [Mesobacillus zeae]